MRNILANLTQVNLIVYNSLMAKYIIKGGKPLKGVINISGNKNAVFPCVAAALLTKKQVMLKNIPKIDDVVTTMQILNKIGADTKLEGNSLYINAAHIKTYILPTDLMRKLRGSIVIVGALLSRTGKAQFSFPGGDIVGKRSIETHLEGFKNLGFKVIKNDLNFIVLPGGLKKEIIFLEEASVTATENLILASVLRSGKVVLKNCATEPHIADLCSMLIKMGAKVKGTGTQTLIINGVKTLRGVEFTLGPDYLEMGTYAVAAAITRGKIGLKNCSIKDLEPVVYPLKKMGIGLEKNQGIVYTSSKNILSIPKLHTNIWPGFPTDLMSAFIVLATQAKGVSLLHDWMYETRMFFVDKLVNMGANITISDPHRVLVYGPSKLHGRELETPDIRAGMALVLAALVAKGESVINKAELIDRGYEDVAGKLSSLGADIEKQESV